MNDAQELLRLARWAIVPAHFVELSRHVTGKLLWRFQSRDLASSVHLYPPTVAEKLEPALKALNGALPHWQGGTEARRSVSAGPSSNKEFSFAGLKLSFRNEPIDWIATYDDPEQNEWGHRWNWLAELVYAPDLSDSDVRWAEEQIAEWIRLFGHEAASPASATGLRWEPYTIAERISNSVGFYDRLGRKPSPELSSALARMARLLLTRLEYKGRYTGNHVFNNARGLYLYSSAFGVPEVRSLARSMILRELPSLLVNGALREGSTHYQLLFAYWLADLHGWAKRVDDAELDTLLEKSLRAAAETCQALLIRNVEGRLTIPLFGDISPDFTPSWTLERLLELGVLRSSEGKDPESFRQMGDWLRIERGPCSAVLPVPGSIPPPHVGHHHSDFFHFDFYYHGVRILTDSGRSSYAPDEAGAWGMRPEAHNCFTIDGSGLTPPRWGRFPHGFVRARAGTETFQGNGRVRARLRTDGFKRLGPDCQAGRSVTVSTHGLQISDVFVSGSEREIRSYLHFGSSVVLAPTVSGEHEKLFEIKAENQAGWLRITNPSRCSALDVEMIREGRPAQLSDEYGTRKHSTTLMIRCRVRRRSLLKIEVEMAVR